MLEYYMKTKNILMLTLLAGMYLPAMAQSEDEKTGNEFVDQEIEIGLDKNLTRAQSTQAVSVITNKTTDRRSSTNIGNSIIGQGNGLVSLQGSGKAFNANPTFYVRGLQTLNSNTLPLLLVDGVERDITLISPEEVDHVEILKDAAAVALYGYKGANGAIQITTKRGNYNSKNVKFNYDHVINYQVDRPKFVNSYDYANAMNSALVADGKQPRYDQNALDAFKNGTYPYQFPNVNWVDETFRNYGVLNKFNVEFSGGGEKFRYMTMLNLLSDKGFIKSPEETAGYSTQDKFVRGNLRVNLDIDLSPKTLLKVNLLGVLSEVSQPGSQANLWSMMYSVPSAAFPIKDENGAWGGNATWAGTNNPVAQSTDAAYYKLHDRALFGDITLSQDLSAVTEGLGMTLRLGYDTFSTLYEDHSMSYVYGMYSPVLGSTNPDGSPVLNSYYTGGERTEMGTGVANSLYQRRLIMNGGLNYDRSFGKNSVYSQLKYGYEFVNTTGTNTTIYRQDISWMGHYAYDGKYILDLTATYNGSSRLVKNTKWAFAPTTGMAWVMSKEKFLADVKWINFLKLRTSFGFVNADYLPGMTNCDPATGTWTYDVLNYSTPASGYYLVDATAAQEIIGNRTELGQLPVVDPKHEKAAKFNIGLDATLFDGLNVEFDYYRNHRSDIFVAGTGAYSSVVGFTAPYKNAGIVDSYGFEASLDYTKEIAKGLTLNVGGTFNLNKNEIKEQGEEPQSYSNLVTTGHPLNSIWGYKAIGLFQSQDEIDNAPKQNLGSTPRVGDIRYQDVNNDGVIDANDRTKIGYSAYAPEIYYNFHLGVEYKGLGLYAMFQGTERYSANLNSQGFFWGLINNSNLSQYVYENSWTESNPNAIFPRLSSSTNANNYQTSTWWLRDRSFLKLRNIEVYYNLPKSLLAKTKIVNAAKLYVRGVDLFCFDHMDEVDAESYGVTSPLTRSLAFGVSVTF